MSELKKDEGNRFVVSENGIRFRAVECGGVVEVILRGHGNTSILMSQMSTCPYREVSIEGYFGDRTFSNCGSCTCMDPNSIGVVTVLIKCEKTGHRSLCAQSTQM